MEDQINRAGLERGQQRLIERVEGWEGYIHVLCSSGHCISQMYMCTYVLDITYMNKIHCRIIYSGEERREEKMTSE